MNRFVRYFLRSHRSIFSSLSAGLLLALLAGTSSSAFARTNHNAYVANNVDGTVNVIDTRTNTVTATISGFTNPYGLAVSPNGKLLYVRNAGTANLTVVDTETNTVATTINVGFDLDNGGAAVSGPSVTFSRRGDRAYVANLVQDTLVAINPDTSSVVTTLPLPAGFQPLAVAVSPEGGTVYVGGSPGIMVVDVKGSAPIVNIVPTSVIFDLVITPDGKKLYGSNAAAGNLLVIDAGTNSLEDTIHLTPGLFVAGLAVVPDGRHVYVAALAGTTSTVTVLDTADNSIDTTITADGMSLSQLAITPNGKKLLAINVRGFPNPPDSTVVVIDTRNSTLTTISITVGRVPFAIATQPSPRNRKDRDHDADDRRDQDEHHRRDRDDDHHDRDNDRDHIR